MGDEVVLHQTVARTPEDNRMLEGPGEQVSPGHAVEALGVPALRRHVADHPRPADAADGDRRVAPADRAAVIARVAEDIAVPENAAGCPLGRSPVLGLAVELAIAHFGIEGRHEIHHRLRHGRIEPATGDPKALALCGLDRIHALAHDPASVHVEPAGGILRGDLVPSADQLDRRLVPLRAEPLAPRDLRL